MTLDPIDEMMRQSMHRILEKVGERGEYSVEEEYIRIFGVTEEELELCHELMEEPKMEVEEECMQEGEEYVVTSYYVGLRY